MLIDFSVQNFFSFDSKQELSLVASTTTQESKNLNCIYQLDQFGIQNVLQSAAIFGANGSGKSNFVAGLACLKDLLIGSLDSIADSPIKDIIPFFIKQDVYDKPIEFEVSFIAQSNLYRYGLSIAHAEIQEEWLYWSKTSRETMLFHRQGQSINYNQRSFSEAKLFVRKEDEGWILEKTKSHIPFISVVAQFDGERSNVVINWFNKLNIISGIDERAFRQFTINLFETDVEFRAWAIEVLKPLHIDDVSVTSFESELEIPKVTNNFFDNGSEKLQDAMETITDFLGNTKYTRKKVDVIKKSPNGKVYALPLDLESEGTRKLLFLLGPLYDAIKNDEVLVIDEFDNKFHSLLSRFIIDIYNQHNFAKSQLILTCHDTNLLTNELFRRDQIWFVEKNKHHESELYSLVEYKQHYTRKEDSYSRDYLLGKYGAIPLFSSAREIGAILNG